MWTLCFIVWLVSLGYVLEDSNATKTEEIVTNSTRLRARRQAPNPTGHCVLRINEFNTDTNTENGHLFIELRRFCQTGRKRRRTQRITSMKKYYIIILRGSPSAAVFFANLADHHMNDEYIFTIGDTNVPNKDMDIGHGDVYSIYKNEGHLRSLPVGDDSLYGILLLDSNRLTDISRFQPTKDWRNKYIEKKVEPKDIDYLLEKERLLKDDDPPFLLDFVVYGRKVPVTSCEIFNKLWRAVQPIEGQKKYPVRDWDIYYPIQLNDNDGEKVSIPDYTMNRCTSSTAAFSPSSFQYDDPSPGVENPCKGASFFIEDYMNKLSSFTSSLPEIEIDGCTADLPAINIGRYQKIDERRFGQLKEKLIAKARSQPGTVEMQVDCIDEAMEISINHGIVEDYGGTPHELQIGDTLWNDNWIRDMQMHLPNDGMLLVDKEVQQWLRIRTPAENTPITFTCAACSRFFQDKMGNVLRKKDIMTKKGYYHPNPEKNAAHIRRHMTHDVHISAMNYQFQLALAKSQAEVDAVKAEFREAYQETLGPTAKMIRTVFTEMTAEVPFMYHETLVNLQRANGIDLGTHHYHDKAATEMSKIISMTMHDMFLQFLINNDKNFSLTVDASTTTRNVPLLIAYITTLESGYTTTYYYRLIELKRGESADETFQSFWNELVKDDRKNPGFLSYFVSKIAFFVSDSASVMTGVRHSFYTNLREKTSSKELGKVGCLAHKMALVVKASLRDQNGEELAFIRKFEKNINGFYNFYHSRGSKRWQHLSATAEKYEMKLYRLRQNIEVRWATAEFEVIHNIVKSWKALEADLRMIKDDKTHFVQSARDQAKALHIFLTDTTTVLLFHEFLDILEVNSKISKQLQSRASALPDHASFIFSGVTRYFLAQYDSYGNHVLDLIQKTECTGICPQGKCNLEQIEDCDDPVLDGVVLSRVDKAAEKFVPVRSSLYKKLYEAMDDYFDFKLLEAVRIFDNHYLQTKPDNTSYNEDFLTVCSTFSIENENLKHPGMSCEDLASMAYDLTISLMENPTYARLFGNSGVLPPSQFWPYILSNPTNSLQISEKLQTFFEYLLVFTDSSAEAERGFSIVNRISKDARSNLAPENIDVLVRVKINANKPIEDFKAFHYAKEFVKTHYPVDSTQAGGRPPRKPNTDPHRARASRLF